MGQQNVKNLCGYVYAYAMVFDFHQCWTSVVFIKYHSGNYTKDFTIFIISRARVFDSLVFYNIWVYIYNTLGYSYVRKIVLVSIRFRNRIHPSSNSGIQRLSHLDIPTKCYYLTGITILIIMTRFLIP